MVAVALWSLPALAQTPPAGAPPAAPPPAAELPKLEVPTPPPPPPPPPPPATATESMPATRPDVLPPISVGAWSRVGATIQGATDKSKMNDFKFDSAYVELHAGGKIHKNVGVTLNLNGNTGSYSMSGSSGGAVGVMDAIIQFDIQDEFHVWAGHLLVPVDRSNASGPFFMIPWNYPGLLGAPGPHEGPSGRNNGVVVWGDINGGQVTYLAGVFDNGDVGTSPLFSGRLRLALLDKEGGFWGNGSYFGDKDLFTIGVGGQFQAHGSTNMVGDKDYSDINADVLFEKKLGGGSYFTAEGAYYHFGVNDGTISDSLYALLAYATPTIGVGNVQPYARFQWSKIKAGTGTNPSNIDAGVAYLIKGPGLRLVGTYSYTKIADNVTANAIQLGAQAIFF